MVSPYRDVVLREFQRHKVPLNMDVEMPTVETIRRLVEDNQGVAFLPRMCVEQDLAQSTLCEVKVKELQVERKIRLVYPVAPRAQPCGACISGSGERRGWNRMDVCPMG